MSKLPTIRQLCFLSKLSKHGHFGKAAKECFVSQPTFSIGIKEFEDLLGVTVADRNNRKVTFTAVGEEIVKRTQKILLEVDELARIAASQKEPLTGNLNLGVIPTIAPFILPRVLKTILGEHPALNLCIKEGMTHSIYTDMMEGRLDLILIALPYDLKHVETTSLFKDAFVFARHQRTRLMKAKKYSETALPDASILLLEDGHCLRDHALSACNVKYRSKISPYTSSNLYTLIQMVNNDLGVTFVPRLLIDYGWSEAENIELLPMPKTAYREIGFAWRKDAVRAKEFRLFAEYFRHLKPKRNTRIKYS